LLIHIFFIIIKKMTTKAQALRMGLTPNLFIPWDDRCNLDRRERRLLRARMGFHSWEDMLVVYESWDSLAKQFKMTFDEVHEFRRKLHI